MNSDTSLDINNHSNPIQTVAQPKEDNEMLRATDKITALYCRLSVEDTKDEKKNGKEDLMLLYIVKGFGVLVWLVRGGDGLDPEGGASFEFG